MSEHTHIDTLRVTTRLASLTTVAGPATRIHAMCDGDQVRLRPGITFNSGCFRYVLRDMQTHRLYYLDIDPRQLDVIPPPADLHLMIKRVRARRGNDPFKVFRARRDGHDIETLQELDHTLIALTEEAPS